MAWRLFGMRTSATIRLRPVSTSQEPQPQSHHHPHRHPTPRLMSCFFSCVARWKPRVVLVPTLAWPVTPEDVFSTTYGVIRDNKVGIIMITRGFFFSISLWSALWYWCNFADMWKPQWQRHSVKSYVKRLFLVSFNVYIQLCLFKVLI